ncbi:OsmC family protein [Cellulomonas bogoriensis]|uniref:Oxidoreductase n=1 Tax=Cellulomonas bogoriensis 69B4 = DSM 16987 TaxID=1386082 RepID=A0A0A0C0T0_9CELL|nr:OsmC family protein [Cellulomonas bogoriensis]KGM13577.1 oxidoreductase [Cellulomonas bogoriensis 69B4 = DSM 16987]
MADGTHREVRIERVRTGTYLARNARGGELQMTTGAASDDFTPVELLLAAIGGCSAVDVDTITGRRAEPEVFEAVVGAENVRGEDGNILKDITLTFTVRFPDGEAGDAARAALPRAVQVSHDRSCTVSRTVEAPTPVTVTITP